MARRRPTNPLIGKSVFLHVKGFQVRFPVTYIVRPKPQSSVIAKQRRRFESAIVEHVLAQIAQHTAAEIASRIPGGGSGASYAALREVWGKWASQAARGKYTVAIGDVRELDAASRYRPSKYSDRASRWRYGAWFNLEWGREWPKVVGDWVYQENPGPSRSPAESHPPGAGPENIEMRNWIKKTPSARGGIGIHQVDPSEAYQRLMADQNMQNAWLRETSRGKRRRARPRSGGRKLQGQFGSAPIRLGFVAGVQFAQTELPRMLQEALQSIGKAGRDVSR